MSNIYTQGYFHTSSTKNYVAILARIFSGMIVAKPRVRNGELQMVGKRVPIYFAHTKNNVKARNSINSPVGNQDIAKVRSVVPQVNIKILDAVSNFNFNTAQNIFYEEWFGGGDDRVKQHSPAPQTIIFEVNMVANNLSEALEMEQLIVPYFKPNFVVTIKELYGRPLEIERDISFTIQTKMHQDNESMNRYEISLVIECIAYDYPPPIYNDENDNFIRAVYVDFSGKQYHVTDGDVVELGFGDETYIQKVDEKYITKEEWLEDGSPIEKEMKIRE